jgi:hypothetical protein
MAVAVVAVLFYKAEQLQEEQQRKAMPVVMVM